MSKQMIFHEWKDDEDALSDSITAVISGNDVYCSLVGYDMDMYTDNMIIFTDSKDGIAYMSPCGSNECYSIFNSLFTHPENANSKFKVIEVISSLIDGHIIIIEPLD